MHEDRGTLMTGTLEYLRRPFAANLKAGDKALVLTDTAHDVRVWQAVMSILAELGVDAPATTIRSATVLGPGVRVSLVIDGSGRATSATGDEARDRRIEEQAGNEAIDLELVAEDGLSDERVEAALAEARTRAQEGNRSALGSGGERFHD